jgi:hypothetical protein
MRAEPPEPQRAAGSTPLAAAIVLAAGAAVAGLAFAYGRWHGQRPRRIRAEQQLDIVTEAALEVRDLMAAAAPPPEHPVKDPPYPLRLLGRNGNEAAPGKNTDARSADPAGGEYPGPRRER